MVDGDDHLNMEHNPELLADLQVMAADLRDAFVRNPQPDVATRHLAAMTNATLAPVVPLGRHHRRMAVAAMVAAGGVLAFGGLAAAGVLPASLQSGAAKLVHPIGIVLPDPGDHDRGPSSSDQAPGLGGTNPGKADEAPGQQDQPGNSESAPGLGGENPGRSDTAPGQTGDGGNNKPTVPPGQVDNPGQGSGNSNGQSDGPPSSVPGKGTPGGPPSSVPGKATPGGPPTSLPGPSQGR